MAIRVISGKYRGKKLTTMDGMTTRPTADRMRESLFNIISIKIKNTRVLDLFAGTGALGIEALSRGAELAVFIDNYPGSIKIIKQNIAACNLDAQSTVFNWNILKNLDCLKTCGTSFNVVFLDPPYNTGVIEQALLNLINSNTLEKEALVIVEHAQSESFDIANFTFEISDQRRYGKTVFTFLTYIN